MLIKPHKRTDIPKDERIRCPICFAPKKWGSNVICGKCRAPN